MPRHTMTTCDNCAHVIQKDDLDTYQVFVPRKKYPFNNERQEYKPSFWAYFCDEQCLKEWCNGSHLR